MKPEDFEISNEEAAKMPQLFQQLREGYLKWKRTGRLPNGERWKDGKKDIATISQ